MFATPRRCLLGLWVALCACSSNPPPTACYDALHRMIPCPTSPPDVFDAGAPVVDAGADAGTQPADAGPVAGGPLTITFLPPTPDDDAVLVGPSYDVAV